MVQIIQRSAERKHVVICICAEVLKKLLFTFRPSRIAKYCSILLYWEKKNKQQNRILMYSNPERSTIRIGLAPVFEMMTEVMSCFSLFSWTDS